MNFVYAIANKYNSNHVALVLLISYGNLMNISKFKSACGYSIFWGRHSLVPRLPDQLIYGILPCDCWKKTDASSYMSEKIVGYVISCVFVLKMLGHLY